MINIPKWAKVRATEAYTQWEGMGFAHFSRDDRIHLLAEQLVYCRDATIKEERSKS